MGRMKAKNLRFLCATDVAARGIDISNLSHVINFIGAGVARGLRPPHRSYGSRWSSKGVGALDGRPARARQLPVHPVAVRHQAGRARPAERRHLHRHAQACLAAADRSARSRRIRSMILIRGVSRSRAERPREPDPREAAEEVELASACLRQLVSARSSTRCRRARRLRASEQPGDVDERRFDGGERRASRVKCVGDRGDRGPRFDRDRGPRFEGPPGGGAGEGGGGEGPSVRPRPSTLRSRPA